MQEFIDRVLGRLDELWLEAGRIWLAGGWAMIAIAIIALGMFGIGVHVLVRLQSKGFQRVPEKVWRHWIDHPWERKGPIGRLLDFVTGGKSLEQTSIFFQQLRTTETSPFERDLRVMKICVSAAPLVGLLGTVTGMLATFNALSSGSGGDKTMAMIASGISEALITTETGLVIALPGLFFQYHLGRKFERYRAFLAHLETVCTQVLHRTFQEERRADVERLAKAEVARRLLTRLRDLRESGDMSNGEQDSELSPSPRSQNTWKAIAQHLSTMAHPGHETARAENH